ncbi:MAG: hypothetical protein JWQ40_2734 [Segetibacter sp.]|jgi:hypothetical protein|nr:hypothetical protein [Segetibacter sp.]
MNNLYFFNRDPSLYGGAPVPEIIKWGFGASPGVVVASNNDLGSLSEINLVEGMTVDAQGDLYVVENI